MSLAPSTAGPAENRRHPGCAVQERRLSGSRALGLLLAMVLTASGCRNGEFDLGAIVDVLLSDDFDGSPAMQEQRRQDDFRRDFDNRHSFIPPPQPEDTENLIVRGQSGNTLPTLDPRAAAPRYAAPPGYPTAAYPPPPVPSQPYTAPATAQPYSGQPYIAPSSQPYATPAPTQPYNAPASAQPYAGQPYTPPPGQPYRPQPYGAPAAVSQPYSGQPTVPPSRTQPYAAQPYAAAQPSTLPPPPTRLPASGIPGPDQPFVSEGYAPGAPLPGQVYHNVAPGAAPWGATPQGPYGEDEFVDLFPQVMEAPTGRIMLGVGYNSDAGVIGSFIVDEQNFDWQRWPTSWEDLRNATAFRGAGQQLRLEIQPGDLVQRYTLSFREPYLWNTRISFGTSIFLFDRIYREWSEERLGGRVSLGYQLRPDWSINGSLSAQNVNLRNPIVPTPPSILAALGDNDLYTARVDLTNDTRDNAFLPTEGHLIQLAGEQNFGEYDFPRATLDLRQYFLLYQRADTSGRHVLGVHGHVGYTGTDTPVFERFFLGGSSTLRGFDFRGASPRELGVAVGGNFEVRGTVEYLFPLTADDMLRAVVFCDFGTVESDVTLSADSFRVAPGFGFRIVVPALGPAPLAFDFAFPVNKVDGDDTRLFSFTVGLFN